jgi:hypothetical protein
LEDVEAAVAASRNDHDPEVPQVPQNLIDDPKHWQNRAKDARSRADQAIERTLLLEAAEHYEGLARAAELLLREKS